MISLKCKDFWTSPDFELWGLAGMNGPIQTLFAAYPYPFRKYLLCLGFLYLKTGGYTDTLNMQIVYTHLIMTSVSGIIKFGVKSYQSKDTRQRNIRGLLINICHQ